MSNFDINKEIENIRLRLRRYAYSLTRDRDAADDLFNDVVVRLIKAHHRGQFEIGTDFAAWAFRIQRNVFISGLRKPWRGVNIVPIEEARLVRRPTQEFNVELAEVVRRIKKLSPESRLTFLLATFEELSLEEVSAVTGVSLGAIKARVSRARAMLQRGAER